MRILSIAHLFVFLVFASAEDGSAGRFFEERIGPLLANRCFECHGPDDTNGGLRLDDFRSILKGGDSGPAIRVHQPDESLLIRAVRRSDPDFVMPPDEPLPTSEVALLERWVTMGAPGPKATGEPAGVDANGFSALDRQWWAIQPVRSPAVPLAGVGWASNEIDRFVASKLVEHGLAPAPEADRHELVRRAYFDLHGLPPTPEEVEAFVQDSRPDAWRLLIGRLLASPRYGERWAQHWLDVVRWAESDGYKADGHRPGARYYRDYVIRSLNEDKPYDQFVREQLAGDEIDRENPEVFIATAFLRGGVYEYNQRNLRMHWELIMNELTNVTAEAFLGVSIGCAQCHDHKFDPILRKDYYAMQAFVASTVWPTDIDLVDPNQRTRHAGKMEAWEESTAEIRNEMQRIMNGAFQGKLRYTISQFPKDIQGIYELAPDQRTPYEQQLVMLVDRQVEFQFGSIDPTKSLKDKEKLARYEELRDRLEEFEALKPNPLPAAFVATDVGPEPVTTYLRSRVGETAVEPEFLTLLGLPKPEITPTATSTGRRLALADWIASPANPLSTRVIVNRIWQYHFGRGIVATPNDFGSLGEGPSHPELLDWLTARFLASGWSWKAMHELVMTSATYRQTCRREPTSIEDQTDPSNRLLWRFPPNRLDAGQVRDAMLAVAGELQHRLGGASVDGASPYRSVYVKKMRNTPDEVLNAFDAPLGFDSMPQRSQTTTPIQSLLLVNSQWPLDRARAFARRLVAEGSEFDESAAARAYRGVWNREPTRREIDRALEFVHAQSERQSVPTLDAVTDFCHVLLNSSEFLYLH